MDEHPASPGAARLEAYGTPPQASSHRRHTSNSSLGSLYDVLADLDETQLQYLIQEMSHTAHRNVPVSQAVSAFETGNPTVSLGAVRASMLPSRQGLQRQLSKSQQRGKLRLQTAFQRAPSLRQAKQPTQHGQLGGQTGRGIRAEASPLRTPPKEPRGRESHDYREPRASTPTESHILDRPAPVPTLIRSESTRSTRSTRGALDENGPQTSNGSPRMPPAYRRIPRPDFDLPPGVTVLDLLNLLEAEFLSSNAESSPATDRSSSPASFSRLPPPPFLLSPPTGLPSPPRSLGLARLRRQPSRLDMAIEAERTTSGAEEIGLGMLEPRPFAQRTVSGGSAPITPLVSRKVSGESSSGQSVVLEGIFDVLENR